MIRYPIPETIEEAFDRLIAGGGYPRLALIKHDTWECHVGFGNRRKGVTAYGASPLGALRGTVNEADL